MSDYTLEAGGHVLCYRGIGLGGERLLAHIQRLEKRLKEMKRTKADNKLMIEAITDAHEFLESGYQVYPERRLREVIKEVIR